MFEDFEDVWDEVFHKLWIDAKIAYAWMLWTEFDPESRERLAFLKDNDFGAIGGFTYTAGVVEGQLGSFDMGACAKFAKSWGLLTRTSFGTTGT